MPRPTDQPGPPPPFDPELAAFAAAFHRQWPSITPAMIPLLRRPAGMPLPTNEELSLGGTFTVETRNAPGRPGHPPVELLICRPTGTSGPVPALYHIHGGGLFAGEARFDLGSLLTMVAELPLAGAPPAAHPLASAPPAEIPLAVVAVEHRLPPESPHPHPIEDCYTGLCWTAEHAAELGIDPDRIVLEGGSGGGGLAAALALLTRDRGGPVPFGQMLLSPMLDDRNDSLSVRQLAEVGLWDRTTNATAWWALLGEASGTAEVSPYAAPARAQDLSGLPPAFIDVGSVDIFRDEAIAYANQIWLAGGAAELHVWPGGFHGFELAMPGTALAKDAMAARSRWLRRLLATEAPAPEPGRRPDSSRWSR